MSSILAGIFAQHSDYKKLEQELEASGFLNSDYIVYLSDERHNSQYLASVEIRNKDFTDRTRQIFDKNHVLKTFLFENMSIDTTSYSNLKSLIHARSKAEIHNSPDVRIKIPHDGINSEVKA